MDIRRFGPIPDLRNYGVSENSNLLSVSLGIVSENWESFRCPFENIHLYFSHTIEVEAKIYAWFGIILNTVISLFALYWTVFIVKNPCGEIKKFETIIQIIRVYTDSNNCHTISLVALMTAIKFLSVALIELLLLVLILIGIKKRYPMLIHVSFLYYTLSTIIGFVWELSSFTSKGYLLVIVPGILNFYFIYILYALYSKISSEQKEIEAVELQKV